MCLAGTGKKKCGLSENKKVAGWTNTRYTSEIRSEMCLNNFLCQIYVLQTSKLVDLDIQGAWKFAPSDFPIGKSDLGGKIGKVGWGGLEVL